MTRNKLHKKILVVMLILCLLTPTGILLPLFFNAGDAWGEWSAQTVNDLIGYVPEGLQKYSDTYKAPLPDYTFDATDPSVSRQSGYYIVMALIGSLITMLAMMGISKIIIRNEK